MKRFLILTIILILAVGFFYRFLLHLKGLQVTSWWRAPWKNWQVGGKAFSLHQIGWAFDVIPVNKSIQEILKLMPFGKIVVESDHIHLQIL